MRFIDYNCRVGTFSFGSVPQDNPFKAALSSQPPQANANGTTKPREEVIDLASDSSVNLPSEEDEVAHLDRSCS